MLGSLNQGTVVPSLAKNWNLLLSLEALIVGNKRSFRELCSDLLPLHNILVKSHDFIACASIRGSCCYHTVRDCVVICV